MRQTRPDRSKRIVIRKSSGDVFRDLGFSPAQAASLHVRASLIDALTKMVDDRRLTQAQAATLFGVAQPRVSNLVRGRIDLFSIDALVEMLSRAGVRVTVRLSTVRSRVA